MSTQLVPQILGKSCWAASLEMFTDRQLRQCDLLATDHIRNQPGGTPPRFCDSTWQIEDMGQYIGNTKTLDDMTVLLTQVPGNPGPQPVVTGAMPLYAQLQSSIGTSAITHYSWGDDGDLHYVVLKKTIEQQLTTTGIMQWMKVFDPFPALRGRTYYLNYGEFLLDDWFKGIIYHRLNRPRNVAARPVLTGSDPKKLVREYINALPGTIQSEFQRITHIGSSHQILDYDFTVTNTNVSILINNRHRFFNNILALNRGLKMYLAGSGSDYTSFFLNAKDDKYYISVIENGLKYLPVVRSGLANVIDLPAIGAPVAAPSRGVRLKEIETPEKPGDMEKDFIKYFEKSPQTGLLCRFFDIGQEYVFFLRNGRVQVFDPFKSFAYILPKKIKRASYLSLDEFFKALTQFYPFLTKK